MANIQDLVDLFGNAGASVQGAATSAQRLTDKTVETEQKLIDTVEQAKQGVAAWGAGMLLFSGITAFGMLYVAGKLSKKGGKP